MDALPRPEYDQPMLDLLAIVARMKADHQVVEQNNLGYYRTESRCKCGEVWASGGHEGDPSFTGMLGAHRAAMLRVALAEAHLALVQVFELYELREANGYLLSVSSSRDDVETGAEFMKGDTITSSRWAQVPL